MMTKLTLIAGTNHGPRVKMNRENAFVTDPATELRITA